VSEQLRNEFIRAVRADPRLKTGEAMVALIIASYADLDGSKCFPSFEKIAKGAKMSPRSAKRNVQALVYHGFLDFASGGGRTSNTYFLKVPDRFVGHPSGTTSDVVVSAMTPQDRSGVTDGTTTPSGVTPDASGVASDTAAVSPITPYKNRDQDSDRDKGGDGRRHAPRLTPGALRPSSREIAPALRAVAPPGIPSPPTASEEETPPANPLLAASNYWGIQSSGIDLYNLRLTFGRLVKDQPDITDAEVLRQLSVHQLAILRDQGILEQFGLEP